MDSESKEILRAISYAAHENKALLKEILLALRLLLLIGTVGTLTLIVAFINLDAIEPIWKTWW